MKKRIYQSVSVVLFCLILFGIANQSSRKLHITDCGKEILKIAEKNTSCIKQMQLADAQLPQMSMSYIDRHTEDENDELFLYAKNNIFGYEDKTCKTMSCQINYNEPVTVLQLCSTEIIKIKYGDIICYSQLTNFKDNRDEGITYNIPFNQNYHGQKTYMDYKTITSTETPQYQLQNIANSTSDGLRIVNNRYCVAIGTHFNAPTGQLFDIVLENGNIIPCIVGDIKDDMHTDKNNIFTEKSNCCTEFIVETNLLSNEVKKTGDVSYIKNEWNSPVTRIIIYNFNLFQ